MGSSSKASKHHVAAVAPAGPATGAQPDEHGAPPGAFGGAPAIGAGAATAGADGVSSGGFVDVGPAQVPGAAVPAETPPKRAHIRVVQDADGTWHVEVERDG